MISCTSEGEYHGVLNLNDFHNKEVTIYAPTDYNMNIVRLELNIEGHIDDESKLMLSNKPYKIFTEINLKNLIDNRCQTDWYQGEAKLKYIPSTKANIQDTLKIQYRFY